jgi:hypothetical protein
MHIHEYLMGQRHKELLKDAERYRLISLAKRHQVRTFPYYARSLAWLGSRMCSWGNLLESRFGDQSAFSNSQSVDRVVKA